MSEFGRRNTAGSNTEGYRYIRDWAAIRGRRGNLDASFDQLCRRDEADAQVGA
jgi:hypothetical protein